MKVGNVKVNVAMNEDSFVWVQENKAIVGGLSTFVYQNYSYSFNEIRDIMHKILDDALNESSQFNTHLEEKK